MIGLRKVVERIAIAGQYPDAVLQQFDRFKFVASSQLVDSRLQQQVRIVGGELEGLFIRSACLGSMAALLKQHGLQLHRRHELWILCQQTERYAHRLLLLSVLGKTHSLMQLPHHRRLRRAIGILRLRSRSRHKDGRQHQDRRDSAPISTQQAISFLGHCAFLRTRGV